MDIRKYFGKARILWYTLSVKRVNGTIMFTFNMNYLFISHRKFFNNKYYIVL